MKWRSPGWLKLCHSVAGPPRTHELRGCCDRRRENQRVPKWLLWPVLGSGMHEFHPQPTGHTQSYSQLQGSLGNVVFPCAQERRCMATQCCLCYTGIVKKKKKKYRFCSCINLALYPLTFTNHAISQSFSLLK